MRRQNTNLHRADEARRADPGRPWLGAGLLLLLGTAGCARSFVPERPPIESTAPGGAEAVSLVISPLTSTEVELELAMPRAPSCGTLGWRSGPSRRAAAV